jgi:arylsulfatase A-like enzyme
VRNRQVSAKVQNTAGDLGYLVKRIRTLLRRCTRRSFAGLAAAVLVLAGVQWTVVASQAVAAERPNILLINLDDARFDALQYMPKTAGWMAPGVNFSNARVAIPSCCPSRATMFTGRYAHGNGVTRQSEGLQLDTEHTLARYLQSAGYSTAMAGKFLVSWPRSTPPPGFNRHTVIWGGYYNYEARLQGVSRQVSEYSTVFLGEQLRTHLREFEASDSTPWFGYLATQAPHISDGWKTLPVPETKYASSPVGNCAEPSEADRSDKPTYVTWVQADPGYDQQLCAAQIRTLMTVDDEIDLTLRQLQTDGELANTMVIFTSDNGYFWGEHGWTGKFLPYEPAVRVPLRIRWDGHLTSRTDSRLASIIDIFPTITETIGIAPSRALDGRSLLRYNNLRSEIFSEYFNDADNGSTIPTWSSLTSTTRKYVENSIVNSSGQTTLVREYYNLQTDPGELVNLLQDGDSANDPSASELASWAQRLTNARACGGNSCM